MKIPISSTHAHKSVDSIIYRELYTDDDFSQCINLQRSIFNIPDTHLISPLFFKLIARKNPPLGIAAGVFKNNELLGFIVGFATFINKSTYVIILGIKPEYQNKIYGYKLALKYKELSISYGLDYTYCVFDPLEANLARLYFSKLGFIGNKIEFGEDKSNDDLNSNYIPDDKLSVLWDFASENSINKINGLHSYSFDAIIKNKPIARTDYLPELPSILVEIPDNFVELKRSDINEALRWRIETRLILCEYLNNKNYKITDCITGKIENKRKSYYLLEKP